MDITLTEGDYAILMSALIKIRLLQSAVEAGLDVKLTTTNFGFIEMTLDEEEVLIDKLYANSQIAWLKEQREKDGLQRLESDISEARKGNYLPFT